MDWKLYAHYGLEFLTNLGILQGDVLAPLIFIIVLDFILRLAIGPRDGFKVGTDFIADLDFADDLATITDSFSDNCSRLCQSISDIAARHGLLINIGKTKYMSYNIPRPVNSDKRVFVKFNGTHLEEVDDFKYLGSSTSRDINVRKGLALTGDTRKI